MDYRRVLTLVDVSIITTLLTSPCVSRNSNLFMANLMS